MSRLRSIYVVSIIDTNNLFDIFFIIIFIIINCIISWIQTYFFFCLFFWKYVLSFLDNVDQEHGKSGKTWKKSPSLKSVTHNPQRRNVAVISYTPWVLLTAVCGISGNTVHKHRPLQYISITLFWFFLVLKACFNKYDCNFDDVSEIGYSRPS